MTRVQMTDQEEHTASREGHLFRALIGVLAMVTAIAGLVGLYFVEVPEGNREPLLLALGIVLSWGSSVIASEYGATTTGRKVAEAAVRKFNEPQDVTVTNTPDDPVPTVTEGEKKP